MFAVAVKGILVTPLNEVVSLINERDEWEPPGGRIEPGETPERCVEREINEELSLTVVVEQLLDTHLFQVIPCNYVFIVTCGCTLTSPFVPRISNEHKQIGTFSFDRLPSNLPQGYRSSIAAWAQSNYGTEAGEPAPI